MAHGKSRPPKKTVKAPKRAAPRIVKGKSGASYGTTQGPKGRAAQQKFRTRTQKAAKILGVDFGKPGQHAKSFSILPKAAAYQAPLVKAWSSGVKVVMQEGKRVTKPWRKPHVKHQKTTAVTKRVAGGKTTAIGQPQSKNYLDVVGGEAFERKRPNVAMTTDKSGQFIPDFKAAGDWWQTYIKIPIVGFAEKGVGQPKGLGKVIEERKMGIAQAGKFTVQAGEGKTKTYIHQSSRLEAGQHKNAPSAAVDKIMKGRPPTTKFTKASAPSKKLLNLNKEWMNIGPIARAKALKAHGKTTEATVTKYGFNTLTDAQKKALLTKAGYKFD